MSPIIHDVTVSNFQDVIIENSKTKPVLVVFWSKQSPLCIDLLTEITTIQQNKNNDFSIAKVDSDIEVQIVEKFNITSVPSVFVFIDGKGIDGFAGENALDHIAGFIGKYVPDQLELLKNEAKTLFANGDLLGAKDKMLEATNIATDDQNLKLNLAQIYLSLNDHESAEIILRNIPSDSKNDVYDDLMLRLKTLIRSAVTPEIKALENALKDSSDSLEIQYKLALEYKLNNRNSDALEYLYNVLQKEINYENGETKKTMLDLLATLDDPALVSNYRRKLYSLLY